MPKLAKLICTFSVVVILLHLSACLYAQERNFYLENWKPKSFDVPANPVQKPLQDAIPGYTVSINPADTVAPVLPTQLGLNTTFRSGSEMYTQRLNNYKNSGMGAYRFPAGSGSNLYFWDGNVPDEFLIDIDNTIDGQVSKDLNIDEFVAFLDSTGAEATIVVNYFYARYGKTAEGTRAARVNQAADYAAAFVNYVNNVLKAGVINWEVGNECYGKWEVGFNVNGSIVTGKEYGEDFRVFAEKMKAVDPAIKVGAVMYPKSDDWNDQVMKEVKDHADFLVVHNYFTAEKDATAENVLGSTGQINEIMQQMQRCVVRNSSYPADYFPVAMTEYNNRGPHTTTFINACFTADVLGRMMESGYGLATRWVGEWKWKVGTHGLFAVEDPDQADYTVRQAYMVYHYLDRAFGDQVLETHTNNTNLWVYGSVFSDGKYGIMVINRTGSAQRFNLKVTGEGIDGKAWWYEVYANTINEGDKKFYVNGFTSATPGGGPDNFTAIQPFVSNINAGTEFAVRKYSVSFFVVSSTKENSSPRAENDTFETEENQTLSAFVGDNDQPSEDGGNIFTLLTAAQHGTLSLEENGLFTYSPASDFTGEDSFSYTLCNGNNECDTATVQLVVSLPLSVHDISNQKQRFYPNPTNGMIFFRNAADIDRVSIYSTNGKKLFGGPVENPLDISFLRNGTYLLELWSRGKHMASMLVKQ